MPVPRPSSEDDRRAAPDGRAAVWFRRVALASIGAAILLVLLGQLTGWLQGWASDEVRSAMRSALRTALDASSTDAERRRAFVVDADGRPTASTIAAFARQVVDRYGTFEELSISSIAEEAALAEGAMAASGTLRFEHADVLATVRFRTIAGGSLEIGLMRIDLHDHLRGDLVLGAAP